MKERLHATSLPRRAQTSSTVLYGPATVLSYTVQYCTVLYSASKETMALDQVSPDLVPIVFQEVFVSLWAFATAFDKSVKALSAPLLPPSASFRGNRGFHIEGTISGVTFW